MRINKILMLAAWLLVSGVVGAAESVVELNPTHPDRYTVVKGDTLWDIAGRFLTKPWRWPEVWKANPQIENPHLIYPGDVITLTADAHGNPELRVERGSQRGATVKLSPRVRAEPLQKAVPTIALTHIQPFLTQARVAAAQQLEGAPYIVASADQHLISGVGGKIYVRGLPAEAAPGTRFDIVRQGKPYRDFRGDGESSKPEDILGYETLHIGQARFEQAGDPTTLTVVEAEREVLIGDRLLPLEGGSVEPHFIPRAPAGPIEGRIISVLDGVSRIGQYQVVALNLGTQQGIAPGHVLAVYQDGEVVRDTISAKRGDSVRLPDERAGVLMVFRSFERVSYALIMEATGALRVYDVVKNP